MREYKNDSICKKCACTRIDFSKKPIPENKEGFYKQIMEMAEKIQRTIDEHRRNEQDGILVGSNGHQPIANDSIKAYFTMVNPCAGNNFGVSIIDILYNK
jgi:hypothetical protein